MTESEAAVLGLLQRELGRSGAAAEVESAVVSHGKVAECAIIGQADEDSGQAIVA